ncbi:MAG: signal peptidase I [Candidatus Bathyarchaeia archaeon]
MKCQIKKGASGLTEGRTLAKEKLNQLWKNEYFNIALTILLPIIIVLGFWYGSQVVLGTGQPFLAVEGSSMCTLGSCDGWSHPFSPTLHDGDLIVLQGVNPEQIKVGLYDGDIIVFFNPISSQLIVHRAIESYTDSNGTLRFITKGDNPRNPPDTYHVPYYDIKGKVVLRIPWLGHVALFVQKSYGLYLIILLFVLVMIIEFAIPLLSNKEDKSESSVNVEKFLKPNAL